MDKTRGIERLQFLLQYYQQFWWGDMGEWVIKRAIRENDPTYDLPQELKELILQAKDDEEIDNLLADYYG